MRIQLPGNSCIELTRDELKQAHEEYIELVKHEKAQEEYENFVVTFCLNHSSSVVSFDTLRRNEYFRDTYGFYPEEGLDKNCEHYILGKIYCDHECKSECYEDDDQAWHDAVEFVMGEVEDHKPIPIAMFADYVRSQYALDINCLRMIDDIGSYAKDTFTDVETLRGFLRRLCDSVLDADDIARVVLN